MQKTQSFYLAQAALIAAIYVVLVFLFRPLSFGEIQLRIAEALTVLPLFTPAAVPGLTVGCLLGNFLGGANVFDLIFGTLATFLGALGSRALRKHPKLVTLPPIITNAILIPFVLKFAYKLPFPYFYFMITVGVGQLISCGVLGGFLIRILKTSKGILFQK